MDKDWPVVDRNARARRIAASRSGLQSIFEAALSQVGLEVLQGGADGLPRLTAGQVGTEAVFRAQQRVGAFIEVLKEMRAAQVNGADHGWSAGPVSPAGGFVPVRSPGGKGTGGESARKVVARLLAELPVGNGLSGLALVAEAAELPEPVRMNGHPAPVAPDLGGARGSRLSVVPLGSVRGRSTGGQRVAPELAAGFGAGSGRPDPAARLLQPAHPCTGAVEGWSRRGGPGVAHPDRGLVLGDAP